MTSFEILENSFGGSFPEVIQLENPPNLTVKIVEDSFLQDVIIFLSCFKQFRRLYSGLYKNVKKPLFGLFDETQDINFVKNTFIILISAIITVIFFPKFLISVLKQSPHDFYGFISAIKKNYIYLVSKNIIRDNADVNQVLSHENIHILQFKNGDLEIDKRILDIDRVNSYCDLYSNAKVKHQAIVKYLLSKIEIEARVHELVSAFYVETQHFPQTRKEFLVCLLYSNDILKDLSQNIQCYHSDSTKLLDLLVEIKNEAADMKISSPIRVSTHATVDFTCILNIINNSDELFNFINFELPTYYSNILKLYGSNSANSKLQNEIEQERKQYDLKYKI